MSAQERLAASVTQRTRIDDGWLTLSDNGRAQMAAAILAADPTLAQDIEDGTELRLLREALPEGERGWGIYISHSPERVVGQWDVRVTRDPYFGDDSGRRAIAIEGTLAAAARACREALEARKGPEGGA